MIQAFGLTSNPRKAHPPAVDDISFEARAGQVTALLGGDGAGKTTALRLMLELQPGRGITHFRGRPLHRIAHPAQEVGVLLGDVPGHPARSVRGHLRMLCAAAGVPARRADEVLEAVGLVSLREERLGTLSRGMDRGLGLACALLPDPHTLVLDQPTHGLSTREARWLHGMLRAHAREGGTVLFTTTDPKEAARTADRVVTLDAGRLVADQEAAEFARTRLRPRVAVRSPHAARLAALLGKEARTARRSVEVVREQGNRLSVYGSTTADIGEIAFRNGILVHQLADEIGDMGPGVTGTDEKEEQADGGEAAERESAADVPTGAEGRPVESTAEPVPSSATESARAALGLPPTPPPAEQGRERVVADSSTLERVGAEPGRSAAERQTAGYALSVAEPSQVERGSSVADPNTPARDARRPGQGGPVREQGPVVSSADHERGAEDSAVSSLVADDTTATVAPVGESRAAAGLSVREHTRTDRGELGRTVGRTSPAQLAESTPGAAAHGSSRTAAAPGTGDATARGDGGPSGTATRTRLPGARTPGARAPGPGTTAHPDTPRTLDTDSPLPPPIAVRPSPSPLRPLRYEIRRATGIGTGFLTCGAVLVVSAITAVVLARIGHTPQARLFAAWPSQLPLPPAALASGLLGALAFGDEFRHPALAADRGTVPRRLGLLTAKLLVAGATALMLAFLTVGCDAEVLYLVYGRELTQVPADWLSLTASWFGLVTACAWAGVLAAGVFRSTTAGLAAVLAVPVLVVPLAQLVLRGSGVRMAAGLPVRMREVLLLQWPFGGDRYLLAVVRVLTQPVGGAMTLAVAGLLCAYVFTMLRTRVR
ncbi:ATP-binding cassette domain-containing protein [Streptomyces sp. LP11]|uniref:ATP-binding cassette domain-containing protein n=1 Tax=Streptomyces pyxinicus TaxID=2970331 RepID=A0ABT2B908_9ACTN|nr:ATP-binding cassette domain-containing protein [Streptomyces sp. LP11]MCS0604560.1 ATP-binding cassette domain-containing protein [Streptomyces sp. LP11]